MKDYTDLNKTRGEILKNALVAAAGLCLFGVGVYLTIQANIGVAPWDVLNQGISRRTGIQYGNVLMMISFVVLAIDVMLKEPIGLGMVMDAFLVGKTVDLCNAVNLLPARTVLWQSLLCLFAGLTIMSSAMRIYMARALGCGPRDTLLVALCKRFPKLSIGTLNILMWAVVTGIGWILGGQVGLGTIISVICCGPILQTICKLTHFEASQVKHQNLLQTLRILVGNSPA